MSGHRVPRQSGKPPRNGLPPPQGHPQPPEELPLPDELPLPPEELVLLNADTMAIANAPHPPPTASNPSSVRAFRLASCFSMFIVALSSGCRTIPTFLDERRSQGASQEKLCPKSRKAGARAAATLQRKRPQLARRASTGVDISSNTMWGTLHSVALN